MRQMPAGTGECCGRQINYRLLVQILRDGTERYGVSVEYDGQEEAVLDVTPSQRRVQELLLCLRQGDVTPTALRDVVEDWLLR